MQTNFLVTDAVSIQVENDYCDLHNDFDLALLEVNLATKSLRLVFTRSGKSAATSQKSSVTLVFSEVEFLSISSGVLGTLIRDIVEIGYKSPGDNDHDWLMKGSQASSADHLFLRLAGDEFIRVHSKVAVAQFNN